MRLFMVLHNLELVAVDTPMPSLLRWLHLVRIVTFRTLLKVRIAQAVDNHYNKQQLTEEKRGAIQP